MGENADVKCCRGSNPSHVACLDLACLSQVVNASVVLPSDLSVRACSSHGKIRGSRMRVTPARVSGLGA